MTKAYGTHATDKDLEPLTIKRRDILADDVKIKIQYCGVCHSDIHTAHGDWGMPSFPVVPGHEIIGEVVETGADVTKFKKGDLVGVGCMVDACLDCPSCDDGDEQHCHSRAVMTYDGKDKHLGGHTMGGYSEEIVVREHFVLSVPVNLDRKAVAPLLCAGITTYSPLKHWNIGEGDKIGVIGLGGLGHMGVKFAVAMGAEVWVLSRSKGKEKDAKALGATGVLITTDKSAFGSAMRSFDFLLNTVPVPHDLNPYMALLKRNGTMVIVGAIGVFNGLHSYSLLGGRKRLAASAIGGIKETQEMLDFCGEHNIVSDVEMTDMKDINEAWERVENADVRYRFVIDMETL